MSIESKINIIVSITTCASTIISLIIAVISLFHSNKQTITSGRAKKIFNKNRRIAK